MPNVNIKSVTPHLANRGVNPNIRVKNAVVNVNVKSPNPNLKIKSGGSVGTETVGGKTFGGKGYLIGMLGLTDIKSHTIAGVLVTNVSDFKPNIRIRDGGY